MEQYHGVFFSSVSCGQTEQVFFLNNSISSNCSLFSFSTTVFQATAPCFLFEFILYNCSLLYLNRLQLRAVIATWGAGGKEEVLSCSS